MDDLETRIKQYISNELFDDGGICVVWVMICDYSLYRSECPESWLQMEFVDR